MSKFTLADTADVTQINVRYDSTSAAGTNSKGLIYTDVAGVPTTLKAVSSAVAVPAGGGDIAHTITVTLTPGDYWLGAVNDSSTSVFQGDVSGGGSRMEATTYASPASTWVEAGSTTIQFNAYATYTIGGTPPEQRTDRSADAQGPGRYSNQRFGGGWVGR